MSICKYCGEKVGWFKDAHDTCEEAANSGLAEIKSIMKVAVEQIGQGGSPNVEVNLKKVIADKHVPLSLAKAATVESWSTSAAKLALERPLPLQQQSALIKLVEQVGFTQEELAKTDGFRAVNLSLMLWAIVNGVDELYANAMVSRNPFNLKPTEVPIAFFGSVVYSQEITTRTRQGGYGGLSVRVMPGVYTHFGGFEGQQVGRPEMKEVDYGGMLLTNESMYFGGDHTTFRIPFDHIISFHPQPDGIGFSRGTGQGRPEVFQVLLPDSNMQPAPAPPAFGWFLFNAAQFLAGKN